VRGVAEIYRNMHNTDEARSCSLSSLYAVECRL